MQYSPSLFVSRKRIIFQCSIRQQQFSPTSSAEYSCRLILFARNDVSRSSYILLHPTHLFLTFRGVENG